MTTHFTIVAGGTGARTAECLLHLCAAGLGPKVLHLMVVDTDSTNGNLERFQRTLNAYKGCRALQWEVPDDEGELFGTEIHNYSLTDPLEVADHGIRGMACTPAEYSDVLDLFFTEDEQSFGGERGFMARPNLGGLLMGKHIIDALSGKNKQATRFLEALRNEMNAGPDRASFTVLGSVFGGTGASVIPVICGSIASALEATAGGNQASETVKRQWDSMHKSALMMLPYFLPREPTGSEAQSETVDPSRFLADTSNSLSFYEETGAWKQYDSVYLVGSDKPERHRPMFCSGSTNQSNAPYVEELVAAMAALHKKVPDTVGLPTVHAYEPAPGSAKIGLNDLPIDEGGAGASKIARFLQLGCLMIKVGDRPLDYGILQFLEEFKDDAKELDLWPWLEQIFKLNPDGLRDSLASGTASNQAISTYFYRLMKWSKIIFKSREDLEMFALAPDESLFHHWELMNVSNGSIEVSGLEAGRKSIASILGCSAISAMRKANRGGGKHKDGGTVLSRMEKMQDKWFREGLGPDRCLIPISDEQLENARKRFKIADSDEFSRTES